MDNNRQDFTEEQWTALWACMEVLWHYGLVPRNVQLRSMQAREGFSIGPMVQKTITFYFYLYGNETMPFKINVTLKKEEKYPYVMPAIWSPHIALLSSDGPNDESDRSTSKPVFEWVGEEERIVSVNNELFPYQLL